jgi:hypothetical protein
VVSVTITAQVELKSGRVEPLLAGIGIKQDIVKMGRDFSNIVGDVYFADLGEAARKLGHEVGQCRLTLSKPELKARLVSVL